MASNPPQLKLKQEIAAFKSENRKLHLKLVKVQTENFSLKSELIAAKKELQKLQSKHKNPLELSKILQERMSAALKQIS